MKSETRWYGNDQHAGPIRLMAEADGYVMVRRPRAVPFVLNRRVWDRLPLTEQEVTR